MIQTNEMLVNNLSNEVKAGLEEYLGFALKGICGQCAVSGSGVHDGFNVKYSGVINNWSEMIRADSQSALSVHSTIGQIDRKVTKMLLGLGA